MKKLFLSFLILCLFAALITGCKKDKASDNTATAVTEETETTAVKVVQTPDVNGIMISGWYYSLGEDKDGNELMVAEFEAKVGTPVKLYSDSKCRRSCRSGHPRLRQNQRNLNEPDHLQYKRVPENPGNPYRQI